MRTPSKELAGTALVAVVALAVWAPVTRSGMALAPYDEGNTVVAAWRVLEGELLYRDVWQMQAPGTAYLLAAAFKLFGTTLLVERVLKLLLIVASALLLQRLARRVAGLALATAAALLFVVAEAQHSFLRPNDLALMLGLAALLLLLRSLEAPPGVAGLAGLVIGLAATCRHDFGAYTAVAIALLLLSRRDPRRLALFAGGVALVVVPAVLALRLQGTLDDAVAQTIVFPATVYAQNRRLPIFEIAAFGVPFVVLLAGLGAAWHRRNAALLLVALAGLAFYGYARLRPDGEHLLPAHSLALVVAAGLLDSWPRRNLARLAAGAGVLALAVPALALHVPRIRAALRAVPTPGTPETARGLVGVSPELVAAVRFLDEGTSPDSPIFVGNDRHDRIMLNHALLYFLAQRRGVTRYYNLHPGLATTREVQQEIVRGLERAPAIVLWRAPLWDEPNASGRSSGVTDLDDAIRTRYREVARWRAFSGWERLP